MDKELIKKYSDELISMYKRARPVAAQPTQSPVISSQTAEGGLVVTATTLRRLYPVTGAVVTVFSGPYENMEVIDSDTTDESGRSKEFRLSTPARYLSETQGATERPYAQYNVSIKAPGYVEQVNMNIPVFPGVISLQNADLLPISAAGTNVGPRVFNEANNYNL